jgi:hypothetical protein
MASLPGNAEGLALAFAALRIAHAHPAADLPPEPTGGQAEVRWRKEESFFKSHRFSPSAVRSCCFWTPFLLQQNRTRNKAATHDTLPRRHDRDDTDARARPRHRTWPRCRVRSQYRCLGTPRDTQLFCQKKITVHHIYTCIHMTVGQNFDFFRCSSV